MRHRALAVALLALVLAVATGGTSRGRPGPAPDPAPSGELTVLTYNVAGLPEPLSGSEPATNSPLISPLLNAYDLVLLQESWADETGTGLLGYHHLIAGSADHPHRSQPAPNPLGLDASRPGAIQADGLNRLSRFPFGPIDRHRWERCNGDLPAEVVEVLLGGLGLEDLPIVGGVDGGSADCGALKGFSVARTTLAPGVEVDVYNLHADAGGGPADQAARADNLRQLAAHISQHSQGRAVVVGGDTNLREGRDPGVWAGFLASTGLQDACQVVDCGADADVIDKIAVRSGDAVELEVLSHGFERERFQRADGAPLSDHDALAVRLRWRLVVDAVAPAPTPAPTPAAGRGELEGTLPATT
jgi:hypothetical protein